MRAYKGFNIDLTCTLGNGTYQYEIGKTYNELQANCAKNGYHCTEEPLDVTSWYSGRNAKYCMVEASGDISEDGCNRISCTEMTIIKEVTLQQLAALECVWIMEHPQRETKWTCKEKGIAMADNVVIVRGKAPKAKGSKGATICMLKEAPDTDNIIEVGIYEIDGVNYRTNTYYNVGGEQCA